MDRSESRCWHRPDCCLRQPLRRKRDVAKEGDETGKSGRLSRRDGTDQSEGRKRLRAVETTGEVARCHTTKPQPAGSPEEPLGSVQELASDRRRISNKTTLTLTLSRPYDFSGVRPSSAAATSARSSGSDCPNATGSPCVAAPEDGRTPLNTLDSH